MQAFRFSTLILLLSIFGSRLSAQPWAQAFAEDSNANFFAIQKAFYQDWEGRTPGKGEGWKPFKRWEWFWEQRVNPDGSFPAPGLKERAWSEYLAKNPQTASKGGAAPWVSLGPNSSGSGYAGIGRVGALAFHPTEPGTIWAGTPAGGLWKTTNGGTNWIPLTDRLTSTGVSAIVLHPNDPNTLFIATGDGDASDTYSTGVLKSTDGGVTFTQTGLNWTLSQSRVIRAMLINPVNPDILIVAASNGIYQTTNGGTTWQQRFSGSGSSSHDLEFKPGDPNIVYAASADKIRRSTDGGATWTVVLTVPTCNRIALAVTPADPEFVGALCSNSSNSGFQGFYASTNSGQAFTLRSSAPNILGSQANGTSTRGQGWYDLALAIAPNNANVMYSGGVNIWKSTDGGFSWTVATNWFNTSGLPTVHADHHALVYRGNTLFVGCDGGIYSTGTGTSFAYHSGNLAISQIYRVSSAQQNNAAIIGLQDNGTKLLNPTGGWTDETGGDGMQCHIDPSNAQQMYSSTQNGGSIYRSTNGGNTWSNIAGPLPDTGAWITPFLLNPSNPSQIFAGYRDVWRSNDKGTTWTKMSSGLTTSYLRYLAMSAASPRVLYAATTSAVWRSNNGGATFNNITTGLPSSISRIAAHPADSNTLYVTYPTYSGAKIYKTTNGGANWTNVTGTLPAVPANCAVVAQDGTVYIGMDIGIYYRTPSANDWTLYNEGLPNAPVMDMDIKTNTRKLRAATYGRGLWENDLIQTVPPCAAVQISAAGTTTLCPGQSVTLSAANICTGCTVLWSNQQTGPSINVSATGQYTATVSSATCSPSSPSNAIGVTALPATPALEIAALTTTALCPGQSVVLNARNTCTSCSVVWSNQQTVPNLLVTEAGKYTARLSGTCGLGPVSNTIEVTTLPATPTAEIAATGATALCPGQNATLNVGNACSGCTVVWSNQQTGLSLDVAEAGNYTARLSGVCGLGPISNAIEISALPATPTAEIAAVGATVLCPGQTAVLNVGNVCAGCMVVWSNQQTGPSLDVAEAGNYTARLSGVCGLGPVSNAIEISTLPATPMAEITAVGSTALCPGQTTVLNVGNACAGCTVVWSNQQTGPSLDVAEAGSYTAQLSGVCGLGPVSNTIEISALPATPMAEIAAVGSTALCPGQTAVLNVGNACAGCTVVWSNQQTGLSLDVAEAGNYTAQLSGVCGLGPVSNIIEISALPVTPTAEIAAVGATGLCPGQTAVLNVGNVCAGCTVVWSNQQTGPSLDVAEAGNYTAQLSGVCGLGPVSNAIEISTLPATPTAEIAAVGATALCPGQTAVLNVGNICAGCTVVWSNQQTGLSLDVAEAGNYTAQLSGVCGLGPVSNAIEISTLPATPTAEIAAVGATVLCPDQTAVLNVSNACAGCTVVWSNQQTGLSLDVVEAGNYTAQLSGVCGLGPVSNAIEISALPATPTAEIAAVGATVLCPGQTAVLNVGNACAGCTVVWSNQQTGPSLDVAEAGNYTAQLSGVCGLGPVSNAIEISALPATPTAEIAAVGATVLCPGQTAVLNAGNVCAGCTVVWSNQQTGPSLDVAEAGNYTAQLSGVCGLGPVSNAIEISALPATPMAEIAAVGATALCPGQTAVLNVGNACAGCTVVWSNQQTGLSLDVAEAGNYTAQLSGVCGLGPVSNIIEISTLPATPMAEIAAVGSTALCPGQSTTLNVVNACTGCSVVWSTQETGLTFEVSQAGVYTAQLSGVCGLGPVSNAIEVTNIVFEPRFAAVGCRLTASSGAQYQWLLDGQPIPGATTKEYVATQQGLYAVQITNSEGCTGVSSALALNCTVGTESPLWPELRLWPNPNTGQFYLTFSGTAPEQVAISDCLGRLLMTIPNPYDGYRFDLGDVPTGVYWMTLHAYGQRRTLRFVVQGE